LLDGTVLETARTAFSDEPTGVTLDPLTGRLFYSDDNTKRIYQLDPGADGRFHTADDTVSSFSTSAYGNDDPEDIAFDTWARVLFVTDGANNEVFRVSPGFNRRFDGVPPLGDDTVTRFDTSAFVANPEGVAYNPDTGNLYLEGNVPRLLVEVTTAGALVRTIEISAAGAVKLSGLTYAPASDGSGAKHLYIVDRGRLVTSAPNPNDAIDGRLHEMTLPPEPAGNRPPSVNAGPDLNMNLPDLAMLDGSAGDDGRPNPPGVITATWHKLSGPGAVTFADARALDTTARLSATGDYVLRLTVSDGEARVFDEVTVTVLPSGVFARQFRIDQGNDDAEENANGAIARTQDELELVSRVEDGTTGNQTVGLRYAEVDIPPGAQIVSAHVQFKAAETDSGNTMLTIQGEAGDDARAFQATTGNISARPRTAAAVTWAPPPWKAIGATGPAQKTADIAAVIQEIVNQPGWASGNTLVLIISGAGKRVAESYNGNPAGAPLLNVFFSSD